MLMGVVDSVKRMMGWCPNASAIKYKESMHFDTPQMNAPDIGEVSTHAVNGWLNKYRNRILLISVILTLFSIVYFITAGNSTSCYLFLTKPIILNTLVLDIVNIH